MRRTRITVTRKGGIMRRILIPYVILAVLMGLNPVLQGSDDHESLVLSSETPGSAQQAAEKLEKTAADCKGSAAVLLYGKIAGMYDDVGMSEKRDEALNNLLTHFSTLKTPSAEMKRFAREAREKINESRYSEAIGLVRLCVSDDPEADPRAAVALIDELISYYTERADHYRKLKDRTKHYEKKYLMFITKLGKSYYLRSLCGSGDTPGKKDTDSALEYFSEARTGQTSDISVSYYTGLIYETRDNLPLAVKYFNECIANGDREESSEFIRDSYAHAVSCLFKSNYFQSCAETGLNYLYEFPVDSGRITERESQVCFYTTSSLRSLKALGGGVSLKRMVRYGRSRVILEVRAQRASLAGPGGSLGMRTYPITGSWGSSATIQLPSVAVQGVNGTVAVPCR